MAFDEGPQPVPGPCRPRHCRAVITDLEAKLGLRRTPDELMARALVHAGLEHDSWFASLFRIAELVPLPVGAGRQASGTRRRSG
ncbi:hypothetical protein F7Q99_31360 [Streptomyces kaniharaensis]|uniref:Uncharacterized protein n=1 Tax=Streptomyces kaniharaensis TaxID=212423 RepID=A0A6N7L1J4_9ACTN|nr:hypothetical protein [Streptomyces kaniharaensis]MQS16567.1 hypothetical protein [Streptomyces kaniharaensis]